MTTQQAALSAEQEIWERPGFPIRGLHVWNADGVLVYCSLTCQCAEKLT